MKCKVDRLKLARDHGYKSVKQMYFDLYIRKELPSTSIQKILGISQTTIVRDLRRYGIEVRNCGMRYLA